MIFVSLNCEVLALGITYHFEMILHTVPAPGIQITSCNVRDIVFEVMPVRPVLVHIRDSTDVGEPLPTDTNMSHE